MNEQEVRSLVREAVDRHLGRPQMKSPRALFEDASHALLKVAAGDAIEDGKCLIEPSVGCNHCGFCQSYGH
jgi:hypothetical protein